MRARRSKDNVHLEAFEAEAMDTVSQNWELKKSDVRISPLVMKIGANHD